MTNRYAQVMNRLSPRKSPSLAKIASIASSAAWCATSSSSGPVTGVPVGEHDHPQRGHAARPLGPFGAVTECVTAVLVPLLRIDALPAHRHVVDCGHVLPLISRWAAGDRDDLVEAEWDHARAARGPAMYSDMLPNATVG